MCNTIQGHAMLQLPFKFGQLAYTPYWVIIMTNSSGSNYSVGEHENEDAHMRYHLGACNVTVILRVW